MAWDRYQVILEREPFGRAPQPGDPGTEVDVVVIGEPPVPEGPTLAETVRLSVVTRYGGTPAAGFTDTTTGRSFYLFEGQSVEDFTLISVEASSGAATLRKGAQEERLELGTMGGAASGPVVSVPTGGTAVRQPNDTLSYAARQRQRVEEARTRAEEVRRKAEESKLNQQEQVERLTGEALQKHLREYNLQMIRSGSGPPLPIELTEAEVSQLAAEGFEIPSPEGAVPASPADRRLIRRSPRLPVNEPVTE